MTSSEQSDGPLGEWGLASTAMSEARSSLDGAIERYNELSDRDRERLVYLEERSVSEREAGEDLFHTANNALFIMSVNLELLTRHMAPGVAYDPEKVRRWLALLCDKTKEIAVVTRQLLDVGTEGPLYRVQSFVSLRAAIQRAVVTYADIATAKNIKIAWELPDFAAVAVWTDGVAIATVLDNLISNAIKFSPTGTTVSVRMRRSGNDLICAVCDEGPGLNPDDLANVFERRADVAPKPTGGESSSGHGLASARKLVEALGGKLWAESIEGKGSCFTFSLPTGPNRQSAT